MRTVRAVKSVVAIVALVLCACATARPAPTENATFRPDKDQLYLRAHDRTLIAACAEAQCTLWLDGVVVETVTFNDTVAEFVTPLGAFMSETSLFLVARSEGELCPRMFQLLQVDEQGAHVSEAFGNCAPVDRLEVADDEAALHFAAAPKLGRDAVTYRVTMSHGAATVTPDPHGPL